MIFFLWDRADLGPINNLSSNGRSHFQISPEMQKSSRWSVFPQYQECSGLYEYQPPSDLALLLALYGLVACVDRHCGIRDPER
jgi:hypothetical protein